MIRVYVALIALILVVVTLSLGYYYQSNGLTHQRDLIASKVTGEMARMLQEMKALSGSLVVWTGLRDTAGRALYLEPLLKQFNENAVHQLFILDYKGRILIAADETEAQLLLGSLAVERAIQSSSSGYGMATSSRGETLFFYVKPIHAPESDLPIGFIVGSINTMNAWGEYLFNKALRVSFSLENDISSNTLTDTMRMEQQVTFWVGSGDVRFPINMKISAPQWESAFLAMLMIAMTLLLGLWIIRRVSVWAQKFSANTTERLELLVRYCEDILNGHSLTLPSKEHDDEISSVFRALRKMLSQQKRITDELRTNSLVFMTAAEAILVTDKEGRIVEINPALSRMTGYARDEVIGQLGGTLYRTLGQDESPLDISQILRVQGVWHGETFFLHRDGAKIPTTTAVSQIIDDVGEISGRVAVISDVSKLKEAETKLRFLAYHDALTELPNLRLLSSMVKDRYAQAGDAQRPSALLFIDMDRLKALNDNYGHEIGDVVIKAIGKHLSTRLPPGHILCRRSGDEFIAVVDLPEEADVERLQARLFDGINSIVVDTDVGLVAASVSVGIARFPADATNFHDLMICADIALNEVKQTARGTIAWYRDAMGKKLYRNKLIQSKLAVAMESHALDVHYQPEVDLRTGAIVGFEALLRWTDPEMGIVHPSEFIPIVEESFLAERLALYVFKQILRDKPQIRQRFPHAVIALNVSPQAFRDFRLMNAMTDHIDSDDQGLAGLEVELTESDIARGEKNLLKQLQMLAGTGVPIVIDDFGIGYSSLSRLSSLPISRVKIDRSFVAHMVGGQQSRIVEVIINLASVLKLAVTAEGVETQEQRQALIRLGCIRAQGWLFARAMPLENVLSLPAVLEPVQIE